MRPGISHTNDAISVMGQFVDLLIRKRPSINRKAALSLLFLSLELNVASLQDKAGDDAMESAALVGKVRVCCAQGTEVFAGAGLEVGTEVKDYATG